MTHDAPALLDLLVRLGLAQYSRDLDDPTLLPVRREGEAAAAAAGCHGAGWRGQAEALRRAWITASGPLARFAARHDLGQPELFLAGLAAACEARRAAALAVAALQAPFPGARPCMHLALDLLQDLFDAGPGDAVALAGSALFRAGLLDLAGNDALPQRILSIRLDFWQVLAGGRPAWPGARVLPEAGGAFAPEGGLAAAAAALGSGTTAGIVLRGPPGSGRGAAAAWVAAQLGRVPMEVAAATLHDDRAFAAACDACEWLPVLRLPAEAGDAPHPAGATPCIFLAGPRGAVDGEQLIQVALAPQGAAARRRLWRAALGAQGDGLTDGILDAAVLYPAAIEAAGRGARLLAAGRKVTPSDLRAARLTLAPEALGRLAHPVARDVHAAALVAAPGLAADLETFVARCRQRESLWEGLGPSLAASATRGVRALFAGESGTGKTMAASYVATALAAPLYRCDLAAVMNKYIGESEKNLGALLDHAEAADAVLLFDEADALFGRRGEGSETGERYANMLTNYLLTRLEAHDGIVILTANSKARIDPAFWRRLDQVIDFPTPGYEERLKLWRSHLGCRAPDEAEMMRLAAYCDLPGGSVRNVVLAAAALVPPGGEIGLDSLSPALRREYAKLRRPLPAGLALALRAAG